jgi:pimeloyl-ACP methyl ester carboxylesterase
LSQDDAEARSIAALQECADTLTAQGVDLTAFNTAENADDLADVPVALGYEQANYYGLSYGANVILNVMRRHPERVRTAILEGVSALDMNVFPLFASSLEHAVQQVIAACGEDRACQAAFPDLEATTFGLLEQLNQEPITIHVPDPKTGEVVDAVMSGDLVISSLTSDLYYPANVGLMPGWFDALAAQQYDVLIPYLQSQLNAPPPKHEDDTGAFFSYRCSDNVLGQPQEEIDAALSSVHPTLQEYFRTSVGITQQRCAVWPVETASQETLEPVVSDIPVLMMSGRFDPVTPAYFADHVLETLPNGYHFIFPTLGHGVGAVGNYCGARISVAFLNTPTAAPDASCIQREPPIHFVIPGN